MIIHGSLMGYHNSCGCLQEESVYAKLKGAHPQS
jgi:hypothetical protein